MDVTFDYANRAIPARICEFATNTGIVERPVALPIFITMLLMRANISGQYRGMVEDIDRREALRTAQQARA
jgi:hypothetical protein